MPRTFTWFQGQKPTEYAELTVGLQWTGETLVQTNVGGWSDDSTGLGGVRWEDFRDPAQLTYRTYVTRQDRAERELDAVLRVAGAEGFAAGLDPAWKAALTILVGGMSFAEWGVAMSMQYVQRFCLGSTIAQSAQLQVSDELRHAQRDLEWFDLLTGGSAVEADEHRRAWMDNQAMQPLRRYVETALVIEDWAEVIVAVNVVLEGLLQPYLRTVHTEGGRAYGDLATVVLAQQIWTDEERHLLWADALVDFAIESNDANRDIVAGWVDTYLPEAEAAVAAIDAALPAPARGEAASGARAELERRLKAFGLEAPSLSS